MYVDTSEVKDLARDLETAPARTDAKASRVIDTSLHAVERDAKATVEVETGELRDSIHTVSHGLVGEVVAGTDHAEYVEDGTSEMAPRPYMRPAAERHTEGLVRDLQDIAGDFL